MKTDASPAAEAQAIDWVIRQRDPEFADWAAFTDWLEADPAHAAAYHVAAAADEDMEALPRPPVVVPSPRRVMPTRRGWLAGALAASVAGVIGYSALTRDDVYWIETAPGETRTIQIADGSRVEINGRTRIALDRDRPRYARLESGEAMFVVVHRDGDPFTVDVAGASLVDMGTAFNVIRRDRTTSVAVSEGLVVYNPRDEAVRIAAGNRLEAVDGASTELRPIEIGAVGSWRAGQLVYEGAPLSAVAEDLWRSTGLRVTVSPEVVALSFTGVIVIGADKEHAIRDVADLAGLRAVRSGDGWTWSR